MNLERNDANIYGLVTQLVEHTLRKNRPENGNSYTPPRDDIKTVRSFRSKAYEILLNKSKKVYSQGTFIYFLHMYYIYVLLYYIYYL